MTESSSEDAVFCIERAEVPHALWAWCASADMTSAGEHFAFARHNSLTCPRTTDHAGKPAAARVVVSDVCDSMRVSVQSRTIFEQLRVYVLLLLFICVAR